MPQLFRFTVTVTVTVTLASYLVGIAVPSALPRRAASSPLPGASSRPLWPSCVLRLLSASGASRTSGREIKWDEEKKRGEGENN